MTTGRLIERDRRENAARTGSRYVPIFSQDARPGSPILPWEPRRAVRQPGVDREHRHL